MNMTKTPKSTPQLALNALTSFAASLFILSCFLLSPACKKNDINGDPVDYGAAVEGDTVNSALLTSLQKVDGAKGKTNEFVHYEDFQEIAGGAAVQTLNDTGETLVEREEDAQKIIYTIVQHRYNYSSGAARKTSTLVTRGHCKTNCTTTESSRAVLQLASQIHAKSINPSYLLEQTLAKLVFKPDAPKQSADWPAEIPVFKWSDGNPMDVMRAAMSTSLNMSAASGNVGTSATRVTYHALQKSSVKFAPPTKVSSKPGCNGLPSCSVEADVISFDQVAWSNSADPQKIHFEFTISSNVPLLATLMNKCITLLVPTGGTRTLVRQCSTVRDFQFGTE